MMADGLRLVVLKTEMKTAGVEEKICMRSTEYCERGIKSGRGKTVSGYN